MTKKNKKKYKRNKLYQWWYLYIWKDKTKFAPIPYKQFEKYMLKVIKSVLKNLSITID